MTKNQKYLQASRYLNRSAYYIIHAADIRKGQFWFYGPQFIRDITGDTSQIEEGMRVYMIDGKLCLETPTDIIKDRLDEYPVKHDFYEDLYNHLRYQGVPEQYVTKVASYCSEKGHPYGYHEVFNVSWDLIEIFK